MGPCQAKVLENAKPLGFTKPEVPHFPSEARLRLSWTAKSPKVIISPVKTLCLDCTNHTSPQKEW